METQRFSLNESPVLVEDFLTGETVTIQLWDLSDGSEVALDDDACTEIGTSAFFRWALSNITTPPTSFTEYLYQMTNVGGTERWGKVVLYDPDDMANGANQVTITVQDSESTPIANVEVKIYNAAETLLLDKKRTNVSGQAVFALDNGSYKVRMAKVQCSFTVPEDLTVSGATTQTYTGTPITISAPADSSSCRVFDYAYNQSGSAPLSELKAYATITALPMNANSKLHVGSKVQAIFDPSTGQFYWDIVQGAVCQFKCDELGISYQRTIPSSATARLSSISA